MKNDTNKPNRNKPAHEIRLRGLRATIFITAWDWRCTTKPGKLYRHIFKWPDNGKFELPAVKPRITRAYLLADPKRHKLKFKQTYQGVSLTLPDKAPDAIASVVCLETR